MATSVGLPNVIAHGMLTMAEAVRVVTDWVRRPGSRRGVRRAVHQTGARARRRRGRDCSRSAGKVIEVLDGGRVKVELTATCDGVKVLGMARAVVQLA